MAKLTLIQIKEAIENLLSQNFSGVTIHKTGVLKEFARPSFFVLLVSVDSNDQLYNRLRTIGVEIHYFPADRYQYTVELLNVQDQLESTFGLNMVVGDRTVTFDNGSANVVDGVLHYSLSFMFVEDQPQSAPGPLMEELNYNG